MAEPFLGEIRIMSFDFPPKGWAQCNGQFLPINQNQGLFSLLGTTYGGNGQTTFALPNLQGRVPIHTGSGHTLGEAGGAAASTLSIAQLPEHVHVLNATNTDGTVTNPNGNLLARATVAAYSTPQSLVAMRPDKIANAGGSQAHENRQPFLTLAFCIALVGIFPSQN